MKFMKLGSKPDQFQSDGDNIRYVATELAVDMVINVGEVKFHLHKFPLLSKSSHLQKLISTSTSETDEINLHDIPGGPAAFELCAKFCYNMVTTLNAYNVVPVRCAAEYLDMSESFEKGNLAHKIDVFLASGIFRSWKDSIIVLRATKPLLPWTEDLKIISRCVDSIASRASVDPARVDWSYTYNWKKLSSEKKQQMVPIDWWVEDLCEVPVDLYKQVINSIQAKGRIPADVIGESLKTYALKRLPGLHKGNYQNKHKHLVETITWLLPAEKNCIQSGFLLKLLQASCLLGCDETGRGMLMVKISEQLEHVTLSDLLTRSENGDVALYNMDLVQRLVEQFVMQECGPQTEDPEFYSGFGSDSSKIKVARLVDGYLAEAARDPSLQLSSFLDLANMVSGFPRSTHDGIYRAIDMYLKEHPGMSKGEKKKICRLMDCRKLSADACSHAVQNERLPLRMVVQVLFFEQSRASGNSLPAGPMRSLMPGGSHGSSRSGTTYTDEDRTSSEMKALRGELALLRLRKERQGENSSSDTSESPASTSE